MRACAGRIFEGGRQVRLVVCDDDPMVRSTIRRLAVDAGHDVVGEAETSVDALDLLRNLKPDLIVVDLALRFSSGWDVLAIAAAAGVRAIIFSSFISAEVRTTGAGAPIVIEKPDFIALARALERVEFEGHPERADRRTVPRPEPATARSFYEVVADAGPGDALVTIRPTDCGHQIGAVARRVLSRADVLDDSGTEVKLLLSQTGAAGVRAIVERIRSAGDLPSGGWELRAVVIRPGESGADAYLRLKTDPDRVEG